MIALEIAWSLADHDGATPDATAMRRLGDAIYASPTYAVDMLLHPWTREDGVTAGFPLEGLGGRSHKPEQVEPHPASGRRNRFNP